MAAIDTEPNLDVPDEFYENLIDMHRDLTLEQSHAANARLILLLANHIGRLDVLTDAMMRARSGLHGNSNQS